MSTRNTRNRRYRAVGASARPARRRRPTLDWLEQKALLAVTSTFLDGTLTIVSDADDSIIVTSDGTNVLINDADPDSGPLAAAEVVSLDVTGGPDGNTIDLSQITIEIFAGLTTVEVDGGDGDDTIRGTPLGDTIDGGFGDDSIFGLGGDDTIRGGFGDDMIVGGQGNDTLLGNEIDFGAPRLLGVDGANNLLSFAAAAAGDVVSVPITGFEVGETIVGFDARPANATLYAVTTENEIYTIDVASAEATFVVALTVAGQPFLLDGTAFGVDFNPVPDRLRIVSDAGQNLRVNVDTGEVTADTNLAFAAGDDNQGAVPNIAAAAYTNGFTPSPRTPPPGTQLFYIDSDLDILATTAAPNDGILDTVGPLGVDVSDLIAFDIVPGANLALASLEVGGITGLYTIDLADGTATAIGDIGDGATPLVGLSTLTSDDDTFTWNNTDGSDIVDGGFGIDTQFVNGAVAGDQFLAAPGAGGRLSFQRTNLGLFTLDIGGVENLAVDGRLGSDLFTVQDLTGVADLVEVNFLGGADADALILGDNASLLGGSYDGGEGSDTVDYSGYTTAVTVDLDTDAQTFSAVLDAGQEVPPNGSPATGLGEFVLNLDGTALSFNVTYDDLQGLLVGAHFHIGPPGENGPIVRGLTEAELNGRTTPGGTFFGTWTDADSQPLTPELVDELRAGNLYFNIHTTDFPGGEIRGQILLSGAQGTATGTSGVRNVENVVGGSGADTITGDGQANALRGGPGDDILSGEAGDDIFLWFDGDGSDTVDGGTGNDSQDVTGSDLADVFDVSAGEAGRFLFTRTGDAAFTLNIGTVENLLASGELGQDVFTVQDLTGVTDLIAISLDGGADNDAINASALPADVIATVQLIGGAGNDSIVGSQGVDTILGGSGNDTIVANRGNDFIVAGPGADAASMVALRFDNTLLYFDADDTGQVVAVPLVGLEASESAVGIDYRTSETDDVLYVLTNSGRVYTATPDGQATLLSTLSVLPTGTAFGVDFNPVPDRLRIVSDSAQNLRANVDEAENNVTTDTPLAYATGDPNFGTAPQVAGAAYTNSFPGTTATTLYDIDANLDVLTIQNPPNEGTLTTVGALGLDTISDVGFDILAGDTNTAYATLSVDGVAGLYTINLTTGAATLVSTIGDGTDQIVGLTVGQDNDTITWNNGDGTDTVDGGAGIDTQEINGSDTDGDNFEVTAGQDGRLQFNRTNLGLFGIDMGGVEVLRMNTLGGGDTVTVDDLTGVFDLQRIESNLGIDDDRFDASALGVAIPTVVNGEDGNDVLIGGPGDDVLDGGTGSNKAVVNGGQNTVRRAFSTPGDYDGDGIADLALYRFDAGGSQGFYFIQQSTTGTQRIEALSGLSAADYVITGDFDADGKADIAAIQPLAMIDGSTTPNATVWVYVRSSDGVRVEIPFGAPGTLDRAAPGDYDGDGATDLATFRPDSDLVPGAAQWFLSFSSGGAVSVLFGAGGGTDLPAQNDFDGDGKTDIATFRPVSDLVPGAAQWFVLPSGPNPGYATNVGGFPVTFGAASNTDQPAVADYDDDGRADLTVFRSVSDIVEGSTSWFSLPSSQNTATYTPPIQGGFEVDFGADGSIAAQSDYTGDLIPDFAVYDPTTAIWTISPTGPGDDTTVAFGVPNDGSVPILAPLFFRLPTTDATATTDTRAVAGLRIRLDAGGELASTSRATTTANPPIATTPARRRRIEALDQALEDLFG